VTGRVQLVAIVTSVLLLVAVLELVRRRRLTEEYSLVWIVSALALLMLSAWREALHSAAAWLGVYYPPALLLLALTLIVFLVALFFSVVVSRQRAQIERLAEDLALLAEEVRERRNAARSNEPAGRP
jgi:hypothetical protein